MNEDTQLRFDMSLRSRFSSGSCYARFGTTRASLKLVAESRREHGCNEITQRPLHPDAVLFISADQRCLQGDSAR